MCIHTHALPPEYSEKVVTRHLAPARSESSVANLRNSAPSTAIRALNYNRANTSCSGRTYFRASLGRWQLGSTNYGAVQTVASITPRRRLPAPYLMGNGWSAVPWRNLLNVHGTSSAGIRNLILSRYEVSGGLRGSAAPCLEQAQVFAPLMEATPSSDRRCVSVPRVRRRRTGIADRPAANDMTRSRGHWL